MAKFCGNCGSPLEARARVCGQCGTPVEDISYVSAGIMESAIPKQSKVNSKLVKRIVAVILILALIFTGFKIITTFTGANGLVHKAMAAYIDYDVDSLIEMSSDLYYTDDSVLGLLELRYKSHLDYALDEFDSSVGYDYKLSYEITEMYTLPERKLDGLYSELKYFSTDYDFDLIEEVKIAEILLTATQGKKSGSVELTIGLSKEPDGWALLFVQKK